MRFLIGVGAILAFALLAAAGVSSAAEVGSSPSGAHAWVTEDSYCRKPEHDYCIVVRRHGNTTQLDLANIGRSIPYRLCIAPVGSPSSRQCGEFETRQRHPAYVFAGKVILQKTFVSRRRTRYRAIWTMGGGRPLGRPLLFTTP